MAVEHEAMRKRVNDHCLLKAGNGMLGEHLSVGKFTLIDHKSEQSGAR